MTRWLLLAVLSLSACVNTDTRLTNSSGAMADCNAQAFGVLWSIMAQMSYNKCVAFYRDAGYVDVVGTK